MAKIKNLINADLMTAEQIHQKLEKGYEDIEKGNVIDAATAFAVRRFEFLEILAEAEADVAAGRVVTIEDTFTNLREILNEENDDQADHNR